MSYLSTKVLKRGSLISVCICPRFLALHMPMPNLRFSLVPTDPPLPATKFEYLNIHIAGNIVGWKKYCVKAGGWVHRLVWILTQAHTKYVDMVIRVSNGYEVISICLDISVHGLILYILTDHSLQIWYEILIWFWTNQIFQQKQPFYLIWF